MPQSLSKLYVHLIFSTKHRQPLLIPSVQGALDAHLLFRLSKNLTLAEVVEKVKTSSSK
jgi:REP-associated tyrosine transposase